MGITVHEHIIIGDNRYYSFADQGHIHQMTRQYDRLVQGSAEPIE
jgi:DNA repair protein RadC